MASFDNLKIALQEFRHDVNNQINKMEQIYANMGEHPSDESNNPIKSLIKEDFCLDQVKDIPILNDMDILLYVQLLEHINITSFRMLKMIAGTLKNNEVGQLLREWLDESADDDQLFLLVTKEYITE